MSEESALEGRCLCGSVHIRCLAASNRIAVCHCGMCRRWSGGPLFAVEGSGGTVQFDGEDKITVYDSSDWAERGFCSRCGTHLFYRLKANQQYELPVGLFGDDAGWVFHQQIFIDEKPGFYDFANDTTRLTGAEVFAQFAPSPDAG